MTENVLKGVQDIRTTNMKTHMVEKMGGWLVTGGVSNSILFMCYEISLAVDQLKCAVCDWMHLHTITTIYNGSRMQFMLSLRVRTYVSRAPLFINSCSISQRLVMQTVE